jgi:hypothetical protein
MDVAWVTVDARDADLARFAAHVAVALDSIAPGIEATLFALLTVPDRLSPAELGEAFGEALYDLERGVVLVLDDFHAAGSGAVVAFVDCLLRAAPRRLHTVLSSQGKAPFPLSRLRIMGDVEELTGADLRFSAKETGELLRLETGEAVDPALAKSVQASVGGWPAAIRLIAYSRSASESVRPREAAGEHQEQLLLDYLGDEVLTRLLPHHRDLLLRASLNDLVRRAGLEPNKPFERPLEDHSRAGVIGGMGIEIGRGAVGGEGECGRRGVSRCGAGVAVGTRRPGADLAAQGGHDGQSTCKTAPHEMTPGQGRGHEAWTGDIA